MQVNWEEWLTKYYPRLNSKLFGQCLQEVGEWRLPKEEFLYIVLGCGYLFNVKRPDEEIKLRKVKRDMGHNLSPETVDLILNEKGVRKQIRELGLVIGPEERPLTPNKKRGPRPRPTTRIAVLTIEAWLKSRWPGPDLDKLVCRIHLALSGKRIQVSTFIRMRKKAEGVKIKIHTPSKEDIPAINRLVSVLEDRYKRFKEEYKDRDYAIKDISGLYPIQGVMDMVLKAVGVTLPRAQRKGRVILVNRGLE